LKASFKEKKNYQSQQVSNLKALVPNLKEGNQIDSGFPGSVFNHFHIFIIWLKQLPDSQVLSQWKLTDDTWQQ
jgi:hypothetical protein